MAGVKVMLEAIECVNGTLSEQVDDLKAHSPTYEKDCVENEHLESCKGWEYWPEGHKDDEKAECKKLSMHCQCELVTHLNSMEDPTFSESLESCCGAFEKFENVPNEHDQ